VPSDAGLVVGEDGLARPLWASSNALLMSYYDTEWGMPVHDEQGMFERVSLEGFQAGLSWETVLRKRPAFREVFSKFDPECVAQFDDTDVQALMRDTRIIRNEAKIRATINNARATLNMRDEGGLASFVWSFKPEKTPRPARLDEIPTLSEESRALSEALKNKGFKFVGPTTMFALMEAVGLVDTHLVGSHRRGTSGVWPS